MPSRRELIEMTPEEIDAFLAAQKTIIIVSNGHNGFPHPMPMWFAVDDDGAVHCTTFRKSQKVLNLTRDPRASLLAESGERYEELKSVLIYSRAEIVDDKAAVVDALVRINTRGMTVSDEDRKKLSDNLGGTAEKRVLLKFVPERYVSWDHAKLGGRY